MDPRTNIWTRNSFGAPPSPQGQLGAWMNARKLITSAYIPDRWKRLGIRGWMPYWLTIPSSPPGYWQIASGDTVELEAVCPVNFIVAGFMKKNNQVADLQIELYDVENDQALINPAGPALLLSNLGGDAKNPFFLKEFYPMDAGNSILADISNLSSQTSVGQIALIGFQPNSPGVVGRRGA